MCRLVFTFTKSGVHLSQWHDSFLIIAMAGRRTKCFEKTSNENGSTKRPFLIGVAGGTASGKVIYSLIYLQIFIVIFSREICFFGSES